MRDHAISGWKQMGYAEQYKPEELNFPDLPTEASYVWASFDALSMRRSWGENGPQRVAWRDIQAWQDLARSRLEPWELRTVLALDDAFIEVWFEK